MKKKIMLLTLLTINLYSCSQKEKNLQGFQIKAPIPTLDPAYEIFQIDNSKDQVIQTKRGSTISIPAASIKDQSGNNAGKCDIKFREFHDGVDILLSGIPMQIKTIEGNRIFETAGMFELRAEKDGKSLTLAPESKIDVRLASYVEGNDYNVFQLDEKIGNWEFLDYNYEVEANPKKAELKKKLEKQVKTIKVPFDKEYFALDYSALFDVHYKNDYNKMAGNEKNPIVAQKAKQYGLQWKNAYSYQDIYFKGVAYMGSMMLWKMISGPPEPKWMNNKQMDMAEFKLIGNQRYEMTISEYENPQKYKAIVEAVMPLESLYKFDAEYWEKNYSEAMAKVEMEMKQLKYEADVYRSFSIQGFGIYNYDRLSNEEDKVDIVAEFTKDSKISSQNPDFEIETVYFLPQNEKTVINYPRNTWDKIALSPKLPGSFIVIYPEQKIGIFSLEDFNKIDFTTLKSKSKKNFPLKRNEKQVKTAEEIRALVYN